jgi:hypothetical protein
VGTSFSSNRRSWVVFSSSPFDHLVSYLFVFSSPSFREYGPR